MDRTEGPVARRSVSPDWPGWLAAPLLALAVVTAPAAAVEPGGLGLPVGPPARLQGFDAAVQARLTAASDGFARLAEVEGGTWAVRWDELLRRPRVLWAPGLEWDASQGVEEARAFLSRHEDLFGVAEADLVLRGDRRAGALRYLTFDQTVDGVVVEGAAIDLRLRAVDGGIERLALVRSSLVPVSRLETTPWIDADQALAATLADLSALAVDVTDPGTLVVFTGGPGAPPRPILCWLSRGIRVDSFFFFFFFFLVGATMTARASKRATGEGF